MAQFILLYVSGPGKAPPPLSDQELQSVISEYVAWGEPLRADGRMKGGGRLTDVYTDPGRDCSGAGAEFLISDGPLAETKEVVGGFSIVEASSYDEIAELCRTHPHLRNDGNRIVIRQLA